MKNKLSLIEDILKTIDVIFTFIMVFAQSSNIIWLYQVTLCISGIALILAFIVMIIKRVLK